jgi:aminocarboxymuconate-semialdehyde decarboxylase
MLPLQDIDVALQELDRIARELPLEGVEIGSHITGVSPGEPRWHPVYAAAERLKLVDGPS